MVYNIAIVMNKNITRRKNTITTGSETIRTVTYQPADPARPEQKSIVAVVGNGAFGGPRTFGHIMQRFVEAAAKDGIHATAVMHHDPWFGRGNYAESYRTERLARVLGHTAGQLERPVHLVGHSWSWPGVLAIAEDSPELVAALEGYTPTGHQEQKIGGMKWHDLYVSAANEALHTNVFRGFTSGLMIARDMAVRFPTPTGRSEAISEFEAEATGAAIALAQKLPIGIIYAEQDSFFHPSESALQQLSEADIAIRSIPTTHLGGVLDYRNGTALYHLAADLDHRQ